MDDGREYACAVVGGGAAGLSAALVLGRALMPTLVVDAGEQSNLPAGAVGGLLGFTGSPAELYAAAGRQLAGLADVERVHDRVSAAARDGRGFALTLASGRTARARALILATGMEYRVPDLPGLAPLWGDTVFHCPFCHGHEVRGRPLALLPDRDRGPAAMLEGGLLLRRWSDDLVVLADGAEVPPGTRAELEAAGIAVEERRVAGFVSAPGPEGGRPRLEAVLLEGGGRLPRTAVLAQTAMVPRIDLATSLGATADPVRGVRVDAMGRTGVPGLFAVGDLAPQVPQVAVAIAAGAVSAAAVVRDSMGAPPGG